MMTAPTTAPGADVGVSAHQEEFRALPRGYELRDEGSTLPTLFGTLAVFNQWTEINSRTEGHFLERIDPKAFNRTIQNNRGAMRVLFNHGKDPQIGDKPLGPIQNLYVDEEAAHYEVPLLDTTYNRDIVQMLQADPPVLGSSFRFEVLREDRKQRPGKSAYNPRGLDERTVREVRMPEFGPVTFPAYQGAKAGLRSLTDRMLGREVRLDAEDLDTLAQMLQLGALYIDEQDEPGDEANVPKMEAILASLTALIPYEVTEDESEDEPDEMNGADPAVSAPSRHEPAPLGTSRTRPAATQAQLYGPTRKEKPAWLL